MPPLFPVAAAAPGSLFFERCVIISARSVKMHYDLSTRNYKQNKQRAVEWAKQFVSTTPNARLARVFTNNHVQRNHMVGAQLAELPGAAAFGGPAHGARLETAKELGMGVFAADPRGAVGGAATV